jgi:hypothetical protein
MPDILKKGGVHPKIPGEPRAGKDGGETEGNPVGWECAKPSTKIKNGKVPDTCSDTENLGRQDKAAEWEK